jgi:CubicO group peptidase (beta-lactamase class C family)
LDLQAIRGSWDEDYSPVIEKLRQQIEAGQHLGGALAVWSRGAPIVDVVFGDRNTEGAPWENDTVAVAFSTTKGMASLALHMLADAGEIDYEAPVARYWPEFGRNGKEAITVRHVLTHEAGLHRIRDYVSDPEAITDWDRMVEIVESMEPAYEPGTANGYHATSFGWLVGELIRRVSGTDIATFVRDEISRPLGLDGFFIGMPPEETGRLAKLTMDTSAPPQIPLAPQSAATSQGVDKQSSPGDPPTPSLEEGARSIAPGFERIIANDTEILTVPLPAGNGVFTARSLAKAYSAMVEAPQGRRDPLLSETTLEKVSAIYNSRPDIVIGLPMMWRLGYHSVFTASGVLPRAIGHFGFGGSGAFLDLDSGLSAALVPNKISLSFMGNMRFVELADVAIQCARK